LLDPIFVFLLFSLYFRCSWGQGDFGPIPPRFCPYCVCLSHVLSLYRFSLLSERCCFCPGSFCQPSPVLVNHLMSLVLPARPLYRAILGARVLFFFLAGLVFPFAFLAGPISSPAGYPCHFTSSLTTLPQLLLRHLTFHTTRSWAYLMRAA